MADSFFGTEFDTTAPAQEADQYTFADYEEQQPYVDSYGESNGVSHDDFGADSVFGTHVVSDYVPANEFDAAPATDYGLEPSFFTSEAAPAYMEPEIEDPRVLWSIKNREYLTNKDQEERAGKEELLNNAREYFDQFYQARNTSLQQRKEANREDEKEKTATALPQGNTPWEKVHSLLNFNSDVPTKDVSRYKSTLFTCKNNNVPVHYPAVESVEAA